MSTSDTPTTVETPTPRKPVRRPLVIGAVVLLVLVLAGGAYTAINLPRGCGVFGGARHDLPCEVPLPSGASYVRSAGLPGGAPSDASENGWVFAAPQGMSARDVHAFYAQQLPSSGWRCVTDSDAGLPAQAADEGASFTAYRDGGTALFVAYQASTGQIAIIVDDFHGALPAPC